VCRDVCGFCCRFNFWGDDVTAFYPHAAINSKNLEMGIKRLGWEKTAKPPLSVECAEYCRSFFANYDKNNSLSECEAITPFVVGKGIKMPKSKTGWLSEKMRLEDDIWWGRQLKKRMSRSAELLRIKSGKVEKYCSDELLEESQENKAKLSGWLDRTTLKNQDGEELSLKTVASKSQSNKKLRRNELMVRAKGMASYYEMMGWIGYFITITNPPSWHRMKTIYLADGTKKLIWNDAYNGASPRESNERLVKKLSLCRAYLSNHCLEMAAIRVAEPHKDGTTHWHILAWFPNDDTLEKAYVAFTHYFLMSDDVLEKGVFDYGMQWKKMDSEKGDAVGYIAKYVAKNIDGAHMGQSLDDDGSTVTTASDGALRVTAWAACWGIRQFQFLGGAPVGVYRELRRIRESGRGAIEPPSNVHTVPTYAEYRANFKRLLVTVPTLEQFEALEKKPQEVPHELMTLWISADAGDYFAFLNAYKDKPQKVKFIKRTFLDDLKDLAYFYGGIQQVPDESIQLLPSINKYGEPKDTVLGVRLGSVELITRKKDAWKMITVPKEPEQATVQARANAYASVRYGVESVDSLDADSWSDVVAFSIKSRGFALNSDLWQ
jgi:hypothetical protein